MREEFTPTGAMVGNVYDKKMSFLKAGLRRAGSVRAKALPQSQSPLKRTSPQGLSVLREEFTPTVAMVVNVHDKKVSFLKAWLRRVGSVWAG